jgi:hypothetical protein
MSDENQETPPYLVGYRKPPRRTQFKKGRSGNPKGRPKGSPNFATALGQALSEQVIVNEGGQRYPVTKLVATVKQLVNKATQGDPRATQQVLNVLHVLDSDSGESSQPSMNITETDQLVMQHLIARIRHTKGENNDTAQP